MAKAMLAPTTARLIEASDQILGEAEPGELAFLHAVLAQVYLPYREPGTRDVIRENGRLSMILSAGHLIDPTTRRPALQGLPFGAKPRLLLLHLCSEAVRRQSPVIPIGESMSALMKELGLAVTGGARGSIGRFKVQLNRLAAARLQMIVAEDDHASIMNPAPLISRFDLWFPTDHRQRTLWPSEVTLSGEFFDSLRGHALPLDPRAIRALQHSARALDAYAWLAHRLPRVRGRTGDRVSWAAMKSQFGPDMGDVKQFKREFLTAMRQVLTVYGGAKVEQVDGGLLLHRSAPPIRRKAVAVSSTPPRG